MQSHSCHQLCEQSMGLVNGREVSHSVGKKNPKSWDLVLCVEKGLVGCPGSIALPERLSQMCFWAWYSLCDPYARDG